MAVIAPADISWELSSDAWRFVHDQPRNFQDHYTEIKAGFKSIVCEYINAGTLCDHKGLGVSPLGGTIRALKKSASGLPAEGTAARPPRNHEISHPQRAATRRGQSAFQRPASGGGKLFKTRLAVPGTGKSGGLRVHFVAYCAAKKVVVLTAEMRRDC